MLLQVTARKIALTLVTTFQFGRLNYQLLNLSPLTTLLMKFI